ncbi:hypothetical protein PPERSA_06634 [Pseudocohnilembus persalinus]|uniref:Uncharacterized protein n=1 Tax=Pseudocohnilembus persalinus TaxID=266149 RepID=A0A0V0QSZ2_PSEPJ|nr:hypothetical protein PPERSA_06634 [Pseudocohnilembus persalinus]|eukprot:KRX05000.1 hypothetical protein PPERSA_06634 [Pseudocohnilembus persalinus]
MGHFSNNNDSKFLQVYKKLQQYQIKLREWFNINKNQQKPIIDNKTQKESDCFLQLIDVIGNISNVTSEAYDIFKNENNQKQYKDIKYIIDSIIIDLDGIDYLSSEFFSIKSKNDIQNIKQTKTLLQNLIKILNILKEDIKSHLNNSQ